jgi:hypothetical protein
VTETLPDKGGYVVAAYLVLLLLLLIYIGIMALRIQRLERELLQLHEVVDEQRREPGATSEPATADAEPGSDATEVAPEAPTGART